MGCGSSRDTGYEVLQHVTKLSYSFRIMRPFPNRVMVSICDMTWAAFQGFCWDFGEKREKTY
ncbi:hypothetical protein NBRC116495_16890 [Aurantivibrio plasticivorans]